MNRLNAVCFAAIGCSLLSTAALAADPFDALGTAGNYTLMGIADADSGTSSGFVQLGSAAHVFGDVGAQYRIETASGVVVDGDSHYGEGGSLHGGTVGGSDTMLSEADWSGIQADAWAAVEAAFELDATLLSGAPASACSTTPTSSDSVGSLHLVADRDDEGLSVYEIDGCLHLADGETLTIEGTPDDRFVVRVTGGLRMDAGSAIELDGLPGSAVMFALDSGGWEGDPWAQITVWESSIDTGADLSGVFVAPWMYWQLGDGTLLPDTRIIAGGVQANIQDMHSTGSITGSPLEPGDDDTDDTDDTDEPDSDGPIWGGHDWCPSDDWLKASAEDSSTGGGTSGGSGPDFSTEEESDDLGDLHAVEDGGSTGKTSQGCAVLGVEAAGLLAWMGVFAAGARRRQTN